MPSFWLDQKLLKLTDEFVKKFNWLTGKDNFWLARQVCIIANLSTVIYFINKPKVSSLVYLVYILVLMLLTSMCLQAISAQEVLSETEANRGIKSFEAELGLFLLRLLFLWGFLVSSLGVIVGGTHRFDYLLLFFTFFFLFHGASAYLMSLNKPPYSNSKAWELLQDKLQVKKLVLRPAPALKR